MSKNLWFPFWLNIALLACAVPAVNFLPGTPVRTIISVRSGSDIEEAAGPLHQERSESPSRYASAFETHPSIFQSIVHAVQKIRRLVTNRPNFQILLFSMFLTAVASSDTKLLVQYISKRYEWTFAQAGYMLSAKAIVNIALLVVVVPRLLALQPKGVHGSGVQDNYVFAILSILVSVVGVLCVAMAFKFWMLLGGEKILSSLKRRMLTVVALMVYALGSALPVFTMSLVKSPLIVLLNSDIQDFSIVMLTKTLGSLVGAPLMSFLWVCAIKIGGAGLGLPYFVSAVSTHHNI
jgi:hypothetical protein